MTQKNNKNGFLLVSALAVVAAFIGGTLWGQNLAKKKESVAGTTIENQENLITFETSQNDKPNVKFFVMSYCPYGNQAEGGLKPVADLLGDKVDWEPRYIISKQSEETIEQRCQAQVYSEELCQTYIDQGYFPDQASCKERLYSTVGECFQAQSDGCLATEDNNYYCSLHGKEELNQNVREICAWNSTDDKSKWWQFLSLVNANCSLNNVASCWQGQAEESGLDTEEIQTCFNEQAIELLDKEIATTDKYQVTGSPTVFVNDQKFPPEGAYDQEGLARLAINDQIFEQTNYRAPETFKQAICSAFSKAPKECKTELTAENGASSGSCN